MENNNKNTLESRRNFIKATALAAGSVLILPVIGKAGMILGRKTQKSTDQVPNSKFSGIQIGAITWAFRDLSGADNILKACIDSGISSVELMGDLIESYAGLPPGPTDLSNPLPPEAQARLDNVTKTYKITPEQLKKFLKPTEWSAFVSGIMGPTEEQKKWRINTPMAKFKELRKMFNDAGVNIHIAKLSPSAWSDGEIDYAFNVAKALGAKAVSDEISDESCKRLAPFAEKHKVYAIFHNHSQLADPKFNVDSILALSPAIMLNLDCGHYFATTGKNPCDFITAYHERIFSVHLNDNLGKGSLAPDTSAIWGKGQTPLADVLLLLKKHANDHKWPNHADIDDTTLKMANSVVEVKTYVEYCKKVLV